MLTAGIDVHDRFYAMCILDQQGQTVKEHSIRGGPEAVAEWLRGLAQPVRVCYEASLAYGVLYDALRPVAVEIKVAHPTHLRAVWASKRKNDRIDARKLATALHLGRVPEIHVPALEVREWRVMIEHRRKLVDKRTAAKCAGRAILRSQAVTAPRGSALWSGKGMKWLEELTFKSPLTGLRIKQLVQEIRHHDQMIKQAEKTLNEIGDKHAGVQLLRTIPGVGPRTAEAVMAYVDDPHRFRSTAQAAAYFGLVPTLDQSAGSRRLGHITREGPPTVRKMLAEAVWQCARRSPTLKVFFEKIQDGKKDRKGLAVIATARHLVEVMVAMLKSGEVWREREQPEPKQPKQQAA